MSSLPLIPQWVINIVVFAVALAIVIAGGFVLFSQKEDDKCDDGELGNSCIEKQYATEKATAAAAVKARNKPNADFCISGELPDSFVKDFNESARSIDVKTPEEFVNHWRKDRYVNDNGVSAKSLGFNRVAVTTTSSEQSGCRSLFVFGKLDPRTKDNGVNDKYCGYSSTNFFKHGIDITCTTTEPRLPEQPNKTTWRVLHLDNPYWDIDRSREPTVIYNKTWGEDDGWVDTGDITGNNIKQCIEKAPNGSVIAGLRTPEYSGDKKAGTCFYYNKALNGTPKNSVPEHVVKCIDPTKDVYKGCG